MKIILILIIIAALIYLSVYLEKQISQKNNILSKFKKDYELNSLVGNDEIENILIRSLPNDCKYVGHELIPVHMLKADYQYNCIIKYRAGSVDSNSYQHAMNNYNIALQSYQIAKGAYQRGLSEEYSRKKNVFEYVVLNDAPSKPSKPDKDDYVSYSNKFNEMSSVEAAETEYSKIKIIPNHNSFQISEIVLSNISNFENEIEFIGSKYYSALIKSKIAKINRHRNPTNLKIDSNLHNLAYKKAITSATKAAEKKLQGYYYADLGVTAEVSDCHVSEFSSVIILTRVKNKDKDGDIKNIFSDINAPGVFFYETNYTFIALAAVCLIGLLIFVISAEPKNNSTSYIDAETAAEAASPSSSDVPGRVLSESEKLEQSAANLLDEAELAYAQGNPSRSLNILRRAKDLGSKNTENLKRMNILSNSLIDALIIKAENEYQNNKLDNAHLSVKAAKSISTPEKVNAISNIEELIVASLTQSTESIKNADDNIPNQNVQADSPRALKSSTQSGLIDSNIDSYSESKNINKNITTINSVCKYSIKKPLLCESRKRNVQICEWDFNACGKPEIYRQKSKVTCDGRVSLSLTSNGSQLIVKDGCRAQFIPESDDI